MAQRSTVEEKFWRRVERTETCWLWTGARLTQGYGSVYVGTGRQDIRHVRAHRLAWELLRGPIPEGLTIDHLCRVKYCVNPDHMEVVTFAENTRRANALRVLPPTCGKGHEFTEANTKWDERQSKDGTTFRVRKCRACAQVTNMASQRRYKDQHGEWQSTTLRRSRRATSSEG